MPSIRECHRSPSRPSRRRPASALARLPAQASRAGAALRGVDRFGVVDGVRPISPRIAVSAARPGGPRSTVVARVRSPRVIAAPAGASPTMVTESVSGPRVVSPPAESIAKASAQAEAACEGSDQASSACGGAAQGRPSAARRPWRRRNIDRERLQLTLPGRCRRRSGCRPPACRWTLPPAACRGAARAGAASSPTASSVWRAGRVKWRRIRVEFGGAWRQTSGSGPRAYRGCGRTPLRSMRGGGRGRFAASSAPAGRATVSAGAPTKHECSGCRTRPASVCVQAPSRLAPLPQRSRPWQPSSFALRASQSSRQRVLDQQAEIVSPAMRRRRLEEEVSGSSSRSASAMKSRVVAEGSGQSGARARMARRKPRFRRGVKSSVSPASTHHLQVAAASAVRGCRAAGCGRGARLKREQ